jgi:hypothetical protein
MLTPFQFSFLNTRKFASKRNFRGYYYNLVIFMQFTNFTKFNTHKQKCLEGMNGFLGLISSPREGGEASD